LLKDLFFAECKPTFEKQEKDLEPNKSQSHLSYFFQSILFNSSSFCVFKITSMIKGLSMFESANLEKGKEKLFANLCSQSDKLLLLKANSL